MQLSYLTHPHTHTHAKNITHTQQQGAWCLLFLVLVVLCFHICFVGADARVVSAIVHGGEALGIKGREAWSKQWS
jgi:hypothetical protein